MVLSIERVIPGHVVVALRVLGVKQAGKHCFMQDWQGSFTAQGLVSLFKLLLVVCMSKFCYCIANHLSMNVSTMINIYTVYIKKIFFNKF